MKFRLKLLVVLLACGMVFCSAQSEADEAPNQNRQEEGKAGEEGEKKEDLSVGRQIAGYAILAFLLIWMFARAGKNKVVGDEKLDQEEFEEAEDAGGEEASEKVNVEDSGDDLNRRPKN